MSGGRVELGLGAGLVRGRAPRPTASRSRLGERFDRLRSSWRSSPGCGRPAGERFTFAGKHYALIDSPALPKPVQRPRPPVIVGGTGAKRTPRPGRAVRREFNVPFASIVAAAAQFGRVRRGVPGDRPRPGRGALGRADAVRRPGRGRVGPAGRGHRPGPRRAAGQRWPGRPRRSSTRLGRTRTPASADVPADAGPGRPRPRRAGRRRGRAATALTRSAGRRRAPRAAAALRCGISSSTTPARRRAACRPPVPASAGSVPASCCSG